VGGSIVIGYAFSKWPQVPIFLKGKVKKMRAKLEETKGNVPAELQGLYEQALAECIAFDNALEDDRITWAELRDIGAGAYYLGLAVLKKLKG
jgi:hypothetical protein